MIPMIRLRMLLVACLVCTGCSRTQLTGIVMNHEGEALPGVSVHARGTELHALTNALGEYRISAPPGEYTLLYAKTGYTIFDQVVRADEAANSAVPDVHLWNLPPENSVFLYQNAIYTPTTWVIPKRYYMADGTTDYGTRREPEVYSDDAIPLLICYRTPRYEARLTRLQEKEAQLPTRLQEKEAQSPGDDSQTFMIWSAGGTVSVDLVPVVLSDPRLLKLEILEPLQPGRYAVHWGALEGYTAMDERMFIFEITEKALLNLKLVDPQMDGLNQKKVQIENDAP